METNSATRNTRKRNNRYATNRNDYKKRKSILQPGMMGFLCTCNYHEKGCVTDAYRLLNLFSDEKSASDKESATSSAINTFVKKKVDKLLEESDIKDEDISTALEKEINELKTEHEMPLPFRKFQVVDTGVKNMIFIASTIPNPLQLVTKIVSELDTTKKQCTRYLLRLLPIEVVCKAYMDKIKIKASELFERYFAQEPKTFSIVFNHRNNNSIKRDEIIEDLAEIILKKNPAPNYYKFKKYNLVEICNRTKNKIFVKQESIALAKEENHEEDSDRILSNTIKQEEYIDNKQNLDAQIEEKE
ncbi:THUMP domain-containing protein 1 homolog isoform X2 [Monomorium pharaonis]|uniref:THUMP domain-containing protein 1 homolog isoform X2 n=1 Tax=Monomorium pharaonis TaxID=307658 RepID=UPI00102E1EFB|nr:THUMP domain-containing protein 1 homolog isoform X2 [Monomorium pharaonis]